MCDLTELQLKEANAVLALIHFQAIHDHFQHHHKVLSQPQPRGASPPVYHEYGPVVAVQPGPTRAPAEVFRSTRSHGSILPVRKRSGH